MITTKELLKNSVAMGRDAAQVEFDDVERPRYDLSQKKLMFKGYAKGSNNKLYKVQIAFYQIDSDGLTPEELSKGMYPKPTNLLDKPIKVDCDCLDYTLGGALKGNLENKCALFTDKVLSGYKKKTDREEKNPNNIPYGCKHIVSFIKMILEAMDELNKNNQ